MPDYPVYDSAVMTSVLELVMNSLNTVHSKLAEYYEAAKNDGFDAAKAIEEIKSIVSDLVSGIEKQVS